MRRCVSRPSRLALFRRDDRGLFLRGPVPLDWLETASALPGKTLAVGVHLWFLAGIRRSGVVAFNITRFARLLHVSRDTISRGLGQLKAAKLVCVDHGPGRNPRVQIITDHRKSQTPTDLQGGPR